MKKMSEYKNGLMLIPATMETKDFKNYVNGKATGILFLDHRPYFRLPSGKKGSSNSGQTMCIVAYDKFNLETLKNSGLGIVYKELV